TPGHIRPHLATPGNLLAPSVAAMSSALVLAVYILTFTVGFPANVFTLAVLVAKWRRRPAAPSPSPLTAAELLLLNLTVADLLLLAFLP
ncbi:FFAR3 protein, partial [Irena cyanogastra]|nr:FFAR3 protein [Irena cyanogastra]